MQSIRQYLAALTLPLVACAHQEQVPPPQDRVVLAVATPPAQPPAPMPETAFQPDAPQARPRLTRTVTLGQSEDGYAQPAAAPPGAGGPTVVVNNNIYVNGAPAPPMYGGYYYGGYVGGYGGRGYGAQNSTYNSSQGNYGSSFGGYSNTGPRTAAPGQTPGVGGNWSPAPSYGPRQMR